MIFVISSVTGLTFGDREPPRTSPVRCCELSYCQCEHGEPCLLS